MANASRFEGKRVIVTGAASGIGQAALVRLVSEGAIALGVDRNEEGLTATIAAATAAADHGGRATAATASVSDEGDVARAVKDFTGREGRLDVLVNMAGILRSSHTTETTLSQFMELIQVNLVGTFLFCREALPHLLESKGNIVNAASTSVEFGHPYMAAYSASKGGIASMTHSLAWEYVRRGVRVNAIAPGGINTPMVQNTPAGFPEGVDGQLLMHLVPPDQKFGQPENVAGVIAMLASADGAHINGEIIRIDGGVHS
ncbi:MAG TPA: SDR family oxidoreductase [Alphaproteobacteria bacterium]|jgi:NAD(P)-dependent dehydrogenase (short-subunit alcohol dehydrogenase family)|nr:SDR family oxidoreductase [Alphaproteobacteria bacterium]